MGAVDERAEVVGRAVGAARGVERGAVVAPVPPAGEVGDGHQFDGRHAEVAQVLQPLGGGAERPLRREGADVQLVKDEVALRDAAPLFIAPIERRRVNDFGRPVHALGLEPRGRVGERVAVVEPDAVALAGADAIDHALEVAAADGAERDRAAVGLEDERDALGDGGPHAEARGVAFGQRAEAERGGHDGVAMGTEVDAAAGAGALGAGRATRP